jgi:hypothetical protein
MGRGDSAGVEVDDGGESTGTVEPGGSPLAVAVLFTTPAFSSAVVTVYGWPAVHVAVSPNDKVSGEQVTVPTFESETAMPCSVSSPVLVTV